MKYMISALGLCLSASVMQASVHPIEVISHDKSVTLYLHFDEGRAPLHEQRISSLIDQGFYHPNDHDMTFHRVVPGFVVQTGDPTATGAGGSGQNIPAEFNDHKFQAGSLGMARAQDVNSADSQFFICLTDQGCAHLTGQYTQLGWVSLQPDDDEQASVTSELLRVLSGIKQGSRMIVSS